MPPKVRDSAITDVHRTTVEASLSDTVAYLQDALGTSLLAYMLDSDPKTVARWKGKRVPRDREKERRLRDIYQVFRLLVTEESPHTVRAWFVGLNPQLDDASPASAVREGRTRDVLVAARSFLAGG